MYSDYSGQSTYARKKGQSVSALFCLLHKLMDVQYAAIRTNDYVIVRVYKD